MGSLAEGFFGGKFWRKFCGKFCGNNVLLPPERVRKFCGKFAEISRKFAENFSCNDPFPNDPISELLTHTASLLKAEVAKANLT